MAAATTELCCLVALNHASCETPKPEDAAIVRGTWLVLQRPLEVETVKPILQELKLRVVEVTDEAATLDGSDVLFTGREFFVGISKWTNQEGAKFVADAFKDFSVSAVKIPEPHHLKSFCSMGGPSTIVVGSSDVARKAIKVMEQLTDFHYEKLSVPDDAAANCIYVRVGNKIDTLVHRSAEEFPESSTSELLWSNDSDTSNPVVLSAQVFQKLPDYTLIPASCTELVKLGASLSFCCILINKKY
ncbi:N(G),N(G)-dimethylarginine dimethylaminohydrolase 1-like [Narcine bancroftii]|uniref:N(G),N(G)-dimethylarginine dimethylaminohydrolase 1-like n=1 Tax=Narcine bancroftii TaxID=1343680 RepID=UPI0038320EF1